ncbi:MAG: DNA internalization-related competence protein ComEC/Rec2, partial [Gammaproteobacteria bacterium]|nr:DNA internalization-related competence protein ComEC/Rec2 [Gammaproteobacteria bacterium]
RPPRGFANPGGFDYERWLFVNRIRATGYVRAASASRRIEGGGSGGIDGVRQQIADRIARRLGDHPSAGIVTALAVGVRHGVSPEQWSVLRDTGTAHLMAISGLHVGLVAGFAFLAGGWLWSRAASACLIVPAPRAAAVAALLAGAGYAAMAGFSLPTQRALILLGVVVWCQVRGRRTPFSAALCLALGAVLAMDPFAVLGPSLWLSFGAVAVLGFGMMHRFKTTGADRLQRLWWTWGRAQVLVAVGLAPLLLFLFGQQPVTAPVANAVAIPWTGILIVPAAVAGALLLGLWPGAGGLLIDAAAGAVALLWPLLETIADADLAVRPAAATPPIWTAIAAGAGAAVLILPREVPARWLGILMMLPALTVRPAEPPAGTLELTVLDVGHGLSAVVRTRQHVLVYDAGPLYPGGFDAGRRIVAPFLRSRGVSRIDTLIASHDDSDHAGGLQGLAEEIPARRILGQAPGSCVTGTSWHWDGYRFSVLHPVPGQQWSGNDGSCVLQIRGPGGSVLLTGDIESAAESDLVRRYGDALEADVLVVPHHGSRTSSTPTFVQRVRPDVALVSNARRRSRPLPHPVVAARYAAAGIPLLETSRLGAIRVILRPNAGPASVIGYRQQRRRYWQRDMRRMPTQ